MLGFSEEAVFNNQILVDGYYADLIWSSINFKEWEIKRVDIENNLTTESPFK